MKYVILTLTSVCLLGLFQFAEGSEVPNDMKEFNVICPANKLLPDFDRAYHECNHGFSNKSCDRFVELFAQLLPEYDCQRKFDSTKEKNYTVPAIWLYGNAALEDYVTLLHKLTASEDEMFSAGWFSSAKELARKLFTSEDFVKILDGYLAEEYFPKVEKLKSKYR